MDNIFNFCVELLLDCAKLTGMTYKEINVWIFCVFWPAIILALCFRNITFREKIKKLEQQINKH